ncbi:Hypothetical predicted protein [Mytilus galloprovincialis]|uniref:TNFR-Cys domain-containing protein n=1 Tax=Mytilus galloprovincialis TaxID=29158 RepID=A0A8B6DDS9_MYTGA|nr:Hypothetical predicted protein [Mytilus galloprovincialis]
MEWILLNSMFLFFSTVQVRGLPPGQGVCKTHQSEERGGIYINVTVVHCCNNYYQIDERCVECPIGHFSRGDNCTKCMDEKYGKKCAEQCKCNSTERCDNVKGCILLDAFDSSSTYKTVVVPTAGGQTAGNGNSNVLIFMACVAAGSVVIVICAILVKNRRAVCRRKKTTTAMEHAKRNKKGQTLK